MNMIFEPSSFLHRPSQTVLVEFQGGFLVPRGLERHVNTFMIKQFPGDDGVAVRCKVKRCELIWEGEPNLFSR